MTTYLEELIESFSNLPSIGRKSATRLAIFIMNNDDIGIDLSSSIVSFLQKIQYCDTCGNISEDKTCAICTNPKRDDKVVCVVQNFTSILAIEDTGLFKGKYHVLGGVISPMDGVSPSDLNIGSLIERSKTLDEIVFALSATMESDMTMAYIKGKVNKVSNASLYQLSKGMNIGNEIQYTDSMTIGASFKNKIEV